jgi:hypothetical protein
MDSYLEIARKVLREVRQPLSAKQILRTAYQLQIVPRDLYGKTQHKTLQARVATDILAHRTRSEFYRTGPGRFFLRALRDDRKLPSRYGREYIAPMRAAQLGRFEVATVARQQLERRCLFGPIKISDLLSVGCTYRRLDEIRNDLSILAYRLHIILFNDGRILLRHRRQIGPGDMVSKVAVGFEGVVRSEDLSLFSDDDVGLSDATLRTLAECLKVESSVFQSLKSCKNASARVALYEVDGQPAVDDLVILLSFDCSNAPEVLEASQRLDTLEWHDWPLRINDTSRFDRWSARFLSNSLLPLD